MPECAACQPGDDQAAYYPCEEHADLYASESARVEAEAVEEMTEQAMRGAKQRLDRAIKRSGFKIR